MAKIAIFGATGFIGGYLTSALLKKGHSLHVASRQLNKAQKLSFMGAQEQIKAFAYQDKLDDIIKDAEIVINLCGTLMPKKPSHYFDVHQHLPRKIAQTAAQYNVQKIIHISAIGADENSPSRYAQSKALGEKALMENFDNLTLFRPSLVVGSGDQFFNKFAQMAKVSPFLPMVGEKPNGALFAPIYVEDVVKAIEASLHTTEKQIYEITGNATYSWRSLMEMTLDAEGKKRALIFMPDILLKFGGITTDHKPLFMQHNIASGQFPNLQDLGVEPTDIEPLIASFLA